LILRGQYFRKQKKHDQESPDRRHTDLQTDLAAQI